MRPAAGILLALLIALPTDAAEPEFRPGGPDDQAYGRAEGYPVGTPQTMSVQKYLVGVHSHYDELVRARRVGKPPAAWSFKRNGELPPVTYTYQGIRRDLKEYLDRNPITGFLVARDDTILFERYQYDRNDTHRMTSHSMAKTVVAMLLGIAIDEGKIRSIDDPAEAYVPDLAGSAYGRTPIRALLHMASGVAYEERYDGKDDNARMARGLLVPGAAASTAAVLAQFNTQAKPPGTAFHYASSETMVLGLVLREATGRPLADYLSERIWQPIGAESDASWMIDAFGQEMAFCCFNAVVRDYARFGRLLAHGGAWDNRQIVPRQWVIDATTVRPEEAPSRRASASFNYGYQVWLLNEPKGTFSLRGIRGQAMFVDPVSKLVMVQTSVRLRPSDPTNLENVALWRALVEQVGRR
jgi:CubicO group peptidase (beta-lactamase class C family)